MFRLLLVWTLTAVRHNQSSAIVTIAAIAVGVSTVVSVATALETAREAHRALVSPLDTGAALSIVADRDEFFPPGSARVRDVPGVESLVPAVTGHVLLICGEQFSPVLLRGSADLPEAAQIRICEGRAPESAREVMLPEALALRNRVLVGQRVSLLGPGGKREMNVTATFKARSCGDLVVLATLAGAQAVCEAGTRVNSIDVIVTRRAALAEVRESIIDQLPRGLTVQRPEEKVALAGYSLFSSSLGLAVMQLACLLISWYVAHNAFAIYLVAQQRDVAIVRLVGASARQILSALLCHGAVLGFFGTWLGIAAGVLGGFVLRYAFEYILDTRLPVQVGSLWSMSYGVCAGIVVTLSAMVAPVLRSVLVPVTENLRCRTARPGGARTGFLLTCGLGLLGVSTAPALAVHGGWLSHSGAAALEPYAIACFVLGTFCIGPPWLRGAIRILAWQRAVRWSVTGFLAVRMLARSAGTTWATGIIASAVTLCIGMNSAVFTSSRDVQNWAGTVSCFDYLVCARLPDPATLVAPRLPRGMHDAIAALPGVDWVRKQSFVPTTVENQPAVLIAMSYADGGPLGIQLAQGEPRDLRERLQAGEVVVARVLATRCQLQIGEPLVLQTLDGPRSFPIAGIADEYTGGGMSLYMDWHVAEAALGVDWVSVFAVACRHEDAEAFQRLSHFCADRHVQLYSQAAFRELISNAVQGVKGALWFVSALICTMAALGLSKAVVLLSVHQQRELKLLYVLGAITAQLRRLLLVQGMVLVIVGSALGLIMGVALGFVFTQIVCTLEGRPADYSIRWSVVLSCLVGAHVVGFVAACTASLSSRAALTPRINAE